MVSSRQLTSKSLLRQSLQIHKALPLALWNKVIASIEYGAITQDGESTSQYRIALAACLLMGDSGLRREEVTQLQRQDLMKSTFAEHVYELRVVGKGNKERLVPVSVRTVKALRDHWRDRELAFDDGSEEQPLIAPLILPNRFKIQQPGLCPATGYTANGLYRLLKATFKRLLNHPDADFTEEERQQLFSTTAHHLRHTFGTLSVASGMPVDVTQAILGHASPGTTAIYVQAQKQRLMEEASKFFEQSIPLVTEPPL